MTQMHGSERPFRPLGVAVLTVSDTRTMEDDRSGALLAKGLTDAGHQLAARAIVADEVEAIQLQVRQWLAYSSVETIVVTGGTGLTPRDVTPEALEPLFDKPIPGFGELFRALSLAEIGTAMLQSRACAGIAQGKVIWALPGSTGACRTALEGILIPQLDSRTRPCSVSGLLF